MKFLRPSTKFTFAQIPNWLIWRSDISSDAKLVYCKLLQCTGDSLVAFPRIDKLALHTGLKRRTAQRAIQELVDLGLLFRVEVEGRDRRLPSVFKFPEHPWMETLAPGAKGPVLRNAAKEGVPCEDEDAEEDLEDGDVTDVPPEALEVRASNLTQGGLRQTRRATRDKSDASHASNPTRPPLREKFKEINLRDPILASTPCTQTHLDREGPTNPPRPELNKKDAPKDEVSLVEEELSEDSNSTPLNGDMPSFDVASAVAAGQAAVRLQRLKQVAQSAEEKTLSTRAKQRAARERKNKALAEARLQQEPVAARERTPLSHLKQVWFQELALAYSDVAFPTDWSGQETGQAKNLLESSTLDHVEDAFRYVIRNWAALGKRFFRDNANPIPSIGFILVHRSIIIPEASMWEKHRETIEEYEAFGSEYAERPEELAERYLEAKKALQGLKLNKDKR